MMKILHITTDFPYISKGELVSYGGLGVCVSQLIGGIQSFGWGVRVLSRDDKNIEKELFDVSRSWYFHLSNSRNWKLTHSVTMLPKLLYLLLTNKFDIVHVHNPPAGVFSIPLVKLFNIPTVMTMHGPWARVREKMIWLARWVEEFSLKNADIVTFDSVSLMNEYGNEKKYIAIINAVDTALFKKYDKEHSREILGLPKYQKLVLYSGRNVFGKKTDVIKDLAFRLPDVTFVVAGQHIDGALNMINLGNIPNNKMPTVYSACDCLILDSVAEGMSRAVLEAMACGTAVFLSNISSNKEILGGSGAGMIFDDIKQLVSMVSSKSAEDMRRMGENGIEHIEKSFDAYSRIIRFMDVYLSLDKNPTINTKGGLDT